MNVEGACHCGNIAYEAEVDPNGVGICHCTDCQVLSGSPYRSAVGAVAHTFRLLRGTPKIYVKIADSGERRAHAFCPDCGAPVYSAEADSPITYALRVGALKQRLDLKPRRQIWTQRALPWSNDLTNIPGFQGQPES